MQKKTATRVKIHILIVNKSSRRFIQKQTKKMTNNNFDHHWVVLSNLDFNCIQYQKDNTNLKSSDEWDSIKNGIP